MNNWLEDNWLNQNPYCWDKTKKNYNLTQRLEELTKLHAEKCKKYNSILKVLGHTKLDFTKRSEIPFIPAEIFKELDLKSISKNDIFKTMTSSGTSGQRPSRIYLDRVTASIQSKILARLMSDILGPKRLPMLIIDSPSVVSNRKEFTARGAGILGFSLFGKDITYALDSQMNINWSAIREFNNKYSSKKVFIFGFTYMIWKHFLMSLEKRDELLHLRNGILLHGGGWKKLESLNIDNKTFKQKFKAMTGVETILNYYGMVEQTGSIYLECKNGNLHAPIFSDILIRRSSDFGIADIGETGIIQVLSITPQSYPGHSLITNDQGILIGEDTCSCGKKGKYFKIIGRVPKAEIRGCSDTFESPV